MILHLNVSQMLTHGHFQAENLDVVFSLFYLYHRWWIHYPACPIFQLWLCKFSARIPAFAEAPCAGVNSPQNLSWLGATVRSLGMEKMRYIGKWECHSFKNNFMSLLLLNKPYFENLLSLQGLVLPCYLYSICYHQVQVWNPWHYHCINGSKNVLN